MILPTGGALEFNIPGAARKVAADLAAGGVHPDLARDLERHDLLVEGAAHDFLAAGAPPLLAPRAGAIVVEGEGAVARATRAHLATLDAPTTGAPTALTLVAHDRLDLGALRDANARALDADVPLLVAGLLEPRRAVVGPLVVPRETACLACYLDRRIVNARARWMDAPPVEPAPTAVAIVASMAAMEAARFTRGIAPATLGHAVSLGLDSFDVARDRVLKAPRCPACSRLRATPPVEPWLAGAKREARER